MHELADGRVVDGLGGRDQRDAALAEVGHHDGVVEAVAGHAGELVDDDVRRRPAAVRTRASICWKATRLVISVADLPGSMYSSITVRPSWLGLALAGDPAGPGWRCLLGRSRC